MEMKTVMTLRRNRNPATPKVNRIALRIRYQARGTLCGRGMSGILFDLLAAENDGSKNCDQDQDAGDFEGQQVGLEEAASDLLRIAVGHGAEFDAFGDGEHSLNDKGGEADEDCEKREAGVGHPEAARELSLLAGVEQHDYEDKEHHDGASVDDQLGGGNEFSAEQKIER